MAHLLFSAAHKSSGKTTVSIGVCAALRSRGLVVQPFKKGPDYIDPMWLAVAAGRPCYNLDFHTMGAAELSSLFTRKQAGATLALIEGNKGLHDGVAPDGSNSNAALARLLEAPVVLVVDTQGMSRGVAPLLLGYQAFDPELHIAGVVLNKVAGSRHEGKLRQAVADYTDIPVLGAVHRDPQLSLEERHLGLVPSIEAGAAREKVDAIGRLIANQVDLEALLRIAAATREVQLRPPGPPPLPSSSPVRIAMARDSAFGFYYPDDLEALERAGARLLPFDTLVDRSLPSADGLLLGGGFPETHAEALSNNRRLCEDIRAAIEGGLPAYAECGGLMYLARSLRWGGSSYPMVGVLPADAVMHERPQGRGYVEVEETEDSPWPRTEGAGPRSIRAHEFHYSSLANLDDGLCFAYRMRRGKGIDGAHDGIVYKNLLASYVHLRDSAATPWARRFVDFVRARQGRSDANRITQS